MIAGISLCVLMIASSTKLCGSSEDSGEEGSSADVPEARMLGGKELLDHPYMAAISEIENGAWVPTCLGTIIHPRWVLTSGICVVGKSLSNVVVDVGKHRSRASNGSGFRHTVNGIVVHPSFDTKTGRSDVALLAVNSPIDFNSRVSAIHLGRIESEDPLRVGSIGWGRDGSDGGDAVYRGSPLTVLESSSCAAKVSKESPDFLFDGDTQICGYGKGRLCRGDEGAPAVAYWAERNDLKQVGIFSGPLDAGEDCTADADHPLVFTKVSAFTPWINEVTHLNLTSV